MKLHCPTLLHDTDISQIREFIPLESKFVYNGDNTRPSHSEAVYVHLYMSATKNVTIQHTKYKAKHSLAANMDEFDDHSHAIPHFEKLFLFKYSS